MDGPLDWFHYKVLLAARHGYPILLMIGFNIYGNVVLRRESQGKMYPNWIFGWPIGLAIFTYPGTFFCDIIFMGYTPGILANNNILIVFSCCFILVQYCEPFYKLCTQKNTFVLLTTWWLADATRASLIWTERAVTQSPQFSRGVWHAFFWCCVGPVGRCLELGLRGLPIPKLDAMVPNTMSFWRHPLLTMWLGMIFWLVYLTFFTDCNLFGEGPRLTAVQCGDKHEGVYAAICYTACCMHLLRGFYALHVEGKVIFGDMCCLMTEPTRPIQAVGGISDLEAPLLPNANKKK